MALSDRWRMERLSKVMKAMFFQPAPVGLFALDRPLAWRRMAVQRQDKMRA
jgi:hypothetical protein